MIAVKILGSLLIALSGYLLSYRIVARATSSVEKLEALEELIRSVKSRIENYCMPTGAILVDLPTSLFVRCGYRHDLIPCNIRDLLDESPFRSDTEVQSFLERFFGTLGNSYKNDELARCSVACEEIGAIIRQRREESMRRQKTAPVLCVCISLAVSILIF